MSGLSEVPIICYGEDGPAFERVCPTCRRFVAFPKVLPAPAPCYA